MMRWFPRLMLVTIAGQLIVYGVRPVLSYTALDVGAGAAELGIITASFSVLSLVAAVPVGRWCDRWGELPFVVAGTAVLAFVPLALMAPQSVTTLVAASAALGLGQLVAMVGTQTLIARGQLTERRESRFASFTVVNSLGQSVAPAFAGILIHDSGPGGLDITPALLAAVAAGAVGVAVALWLVAAPDALAGRPRLDPERASVSMRQVMAVPSMPNAMLASFTVLASIDLLTAYLPALGQAQGLSTRTVGLLLAAQGAASLVVRLGLVPLIRVLTRRRLLALCMVVSSVGMAAVPLTSWMPGLYLVMVVLGLGLGLGQPITMGWVASQAPREMQGTAMSVRLLGNRLGQTVVPAVVGGLAGSAGLAAAFFSPAVLLAGAAVAVFVSGVQG